MNQELTNYLTTLAQIAGVLVGFANLSNAISRDDLTFHDFQLNKLRLVITTEVGLIVIALCLIMLLFPDANGHILQLEATLFFLLISFYTLTVIIRSKRMTGHYFPNLANKLFHLGNSVFVLIPLILAATGILISWTYQLLCGVLFYLFLFLCLLFVRLLHGVLPKTNSMK